MCPLRMSPRRRICLAGPPLYRAVQRAYDYRGIVISSVRFSAVAAEGLIDPYEVRTPHIPGKTKKLRSAPRPHNPTITPTHSLWRRAGRGTGSTSARVHVDGRNPGHDHRQVVTHYSYIPIGLSRECWKSGSKAGCHCIWPCRARTPAPLGQSAPYKCLAPPGAGADNSGDIHTVLACRWTDGRCQSIPRGSAQCQPFGPPRCPS